MEGKIIFIIGSSRSGTTMMSRILSRHPDIFGFHELHFFENLIDPSRNNVISRKKGVLLAKKLLRIQRDGLFSDKNIDVYEEDANIIINNIPKNQILPSKVLLNFLMHESALHGKIIPCEQTPFNIYYLKDIVKLYPNAKFIQMVRDPRDVLISQKRKWKRKKLGYNNMPKHEQLRVRMNYHPYTISKLWNSCATIGLKSFHISSFTIVKFEELLINGEKEIKKICDFLEVPYTPEMIQVPQIGSSSKLDNPDAMGFDRSRISAWKNGGLSAEEQSILEDICGKNMVHFDYKLSKNKFSIIKKTGLYLVLPFQLVITLLLNLYRTRNLVSTIKRRLLN